MEKKIYILKNRTRIRGPYTSEILPQKLQSGSDLIWYKGLADWTQVSLVDSFKEIAKSIPSSKSKAPFWKHLI